MGCAAGLRVADSDYAEAHPPAVSAPAMTRAALAGSRAGISAPAPRVAFAGMMAVRYRVRFSMVLSLVLLDRVLPNSKL
jgi:hypothetical protein